MLMLILCVGAMSYFVFDAMQAGDKIAANEFVREKDKLAVIEIPLKDFEAQKHNREVWYGGRLYDVSSYSVSGDVAYVTVYHDTDEEVLVKNMAESIEGTDKYLPAGSHIAKHKIHTPNDGKILVGHQPIVWVGICEVKHHELRYLPESLQVCSAVIKPPPRTA